MNMSQRNTGNGLIALALFLATMGAVVQMLEWFAPSVTSGILTGTWLVSKALPVMQVAATFGGLFLAIKARHDDQQ